MWTPTRPVPWGDADRARGALTALTDDFAADVQEAGAGWQVAWCAGAGVTGTGQAVLDAEVAVFRHVLEGLGRALGPVAGSGGLFLASSAGGVYSGSVGPPFDERSIPDPLSPYGRSKLAMEQAARSWAQRTGVPLLVGRIANLYGPGQDLTKAQGLISQICRAHLRGQPLSVYVSLDTVRDYLYATDCGGLVVDGLARLRVEAEAADGPLVVIKVLASQRGVTVGAVIAELRRVLKRPPRIVLGSSPVAALQTRDLRLRSVVWPELDARALTPLPVGMKATATHVLRGLQVGAL